MVPPEDGVYLFWIPLGAGGSGVVRASGRLYERSMAWRQRRRTLDLYHTALIVRAGGRDWVVETMWPSPSGDPAGRGVVVQAPVFTRLLGWTRWFRYEVRVWRDGSLPDADHAVGGPRLLASDPAVSARVLGLAQTAPHLIWGRDQSRVGEMWNSNSVVSWLLAVAGVDLSGASAPPGGRAPGWGAGSAVAQREVTRAPIDR